MKYKFIIFLLVFVPASLFGQHYYRIKADFTFKYKDGQDAGSSLVMGTAYYDKIDKKITYKVKFPNPQVWVMQDTNMYIFENRELINKNFIPSPVETSIFNLALQSNMNNFALESSAYTLEGVEEDKGLVIASWKPPEMKGEQKLGKVIIANKDGLLNGVIFKDTDGEILAKQFFDNYTMVSGVNFPREVTQISYKDNIESYQLTTYKNIIIDESGEDHWYRYPVDQY